MSQTKQYEVRSWKDQWAVWESCSLSFCAWDWHMLRHAPTEAEAKKLAALYRERHRA